MSSRHFFLFLAPISLFLLFSPAALRGDGFPDEAQKREALNYARHRSEALPKPAPLELPHMGALGIRRISGKYIDFYTDLVSTPETDSIPVALEAAVPEMARFFGIPISRYEKWHIEAFLMGEREPFEIFGALEGAPDFPNGYYFNRRIWVFDKHQGYYNRFLLLHELVHALTDETFGGLDPRWYSEGIAEYLALHRWDGEKIELGIFPDTPDAVAGFGRIDRIHETIRTGTVPTVKQLLDFSFRQYEDVANYAWSWSFVTLLASNPRYHETFEAMPYLMAVPDANSRFIERLGKEGQYIQRDWSDFAGRINYGENLTLPPIDYTPGKPLQTAASLDMPVNTERWFNSGIRLEAGKTYRLAASGRYRVYDSSRLIPCEPNGVTLRYTDRRPLGQLLAAVAAEKSDDGWQITPVASKAELTPENTGPLLLRINVPTGELPRAEGTITVKISEK